MPCTRRSRATSMHFSGGVDRGKEYLVRIFESALVREPVTESDFEETQKKGRKALPAFYDELPCGVVSARHE
jgi:hypothetical protein